MAAQTLTTAQAAWLYKRGLGFLEGENIFVTRTAEYDWNPTEGVYEAITTGLRVLHRLGARWDGARFVLCHCDHCQQYPVHCAHVDVF